MVRTRHSLPSSIFWNPSVLTSYPVSLHGLPSSTSPSLRLPLTLSGLSEVLFRSKRSPNSELLRNKNHLDHSRINYCFLITAPIVTQSNGCLRPLPSFTTGNSHGLPWANVPSRFFGDSVALGRCFHRKNPAQWPQPRQEASLWPSLLSCFGGFENI